ncbi:beta-propeller domain-containing protein [Anaeromyxobacter diazotrophicus]|uniref:LVIVD repeat protein n=1 Tax=Anaeromyxobacter diazotrophicus TaxID=2590199 RepID=A0A7I9VPG7_9BACT|nr:beta-propeller domain-containing protein [Anaeromyxobacter diazotrophicus]GEJ57847.1 hypothetical protein AMYX_25880 [Anaeromyxobacter diazotrophicus]
MTRFRPCLFLAALAAVALGSLGCRGQGESAAGAGPHAVGASAFESPPPGSARFGGTATAGAPGPAAAPQGGAAAARAVEEADVYARAGTTLYVLNAFRGLQAIDLADPAAPILLARLPLLGTPVDLYLRGSAALVAVSDVLSFREAAGATQPERGSRLFAVDVSDPAHPAVATELPVDGELVQTRLVGDVLYVVSRQSPWYGWPGIATGVASGGSGGAGAVSGAVAGAGWETVTVASFDVRDPAHPAEVAHLQLPAGGWDAHAHVTAERVTLAFSGWSADASGPVTRFRAVDISDPGGALVAGVEVTCPGAVRDRWSMDFDAATGLFRAVAATGWNAGALLQIWASPTPEAATPVSQLAIDVAESLTAARFDGARVYLVTARITDPLWVVDATVPAQPSVAGALSMPGQLDFIEPRGDRLLALGHTSEAGTPSQLAVSLLDVSDLAAPRLLDRATFGTSFGWVPVSPDDLRKAFIVLDPPATGPGLVLVPVQGWDAASFRYQGGTQLLDWTRDALTLRGFLHHPGAVKRSFPLDQVASCLAALSDAALQTVDATDRAAPRELARLDLARSVTTLALLGDHAVELSGDWYRGDLELAVTPALDPDAAAPLARVAVTAPQASLYQDGALVWLLAVDWASGRAWLEGHDLTDPAQPRARGRIDLPADALGGGVPGLGMGLPTPVGAGLTRPWGFAADAALVGHALVVHRSGWPCAGTCPAGAAGQLRVYDLSDPDQPRLASTVDLADGWSWGLRVVDRFAWLTRFAWDGIAARGRYFLDRVDLGDPARPLLLAGVNVPGVLYGASEDGRRVFTLESWWTDASTPVTWAHGLTLTDGGARLDGSVKLQGDAWQGEAAGGVGWVPATTWASDGATVRLYALDLGAMAVASEQRVRGGGAWLRRAAAGKLFLMASWADPGLLVYDLSDPRQPAFERFFRTEAYPWDVVVGGGYAYLPSGAYGVPMVKLAP